MGTRIGKKRCKCAVPDAYETPSGFMACRACKGDVVEQRALTIGAPSHPHPMFSGATVEPVPRGTSPNGSSGFGANQLSPSLFSKGGAEQASALENVRRGEAGARSARASRGATGEDENDGVSDMDMAENVRELCEVNRKLKALQARKEELAAAVMAELDAVGETRWEDDFVGVTIVEQPGRETADVRSLKEAGLLQFVRVGEPCRYPLARRK